MPPEIHLKRIYDEPAAADGQRVLVDRLWPRGIPKERARLDAWVAGLAPSNELRKWYHADPARWEEFRQRYADELAGHEEELALLLGMARAGKLTLLYSSAETERNNATVLRDEMLRRLGD